MTTDNKDTQSELDKDIQEMEQFLEEQEDHFPFDEDDDNVAPVFEQSKTEALRIKGKRSPLGRLLGYFIFLLILGGAGYATAIYAPKLLDKGQMDQIRGYVTTDGKAFIDDMTQMAQTKINDLTGKDINLLNATDNTATPAEVPSLPMPSDSAEVVAIEDEQPPVIAETIADALNIAQQAVTDDSNSSTMADEQVDILGDLNTATEPQIGLTDDLPPMNDAIVDIEADIAGMNVEEVEQIVEIEEIMPELPVEDIVNNIEEPINQMKEMMVEAPEITENEIENLVQEVAQIIENTDNQLPSPPLMEVEQEVVEVKTIEAKPVDAPKPKVQKSAQIAPKPKAAAKPQDPRVAQARNLFEANNYAGALALYTAILRDDPANTAALTGRQLAQAKMRLSNTMAATSPQPAAVETVTRSINHVENVATNNANNPTNLTSLLQLAQQNPNDAQLALNVANAYKAASDNGNALSWYRKALQLDVLSSSGLDRMAIYDAMADLQ